MKWAIIATLMITSAAAYADFEEIVITGNVRHGKTPAEQLKFACEDAIALSAALDQYFGKDLSRSKGFLLQVRSQTLEAETCGTKNQGPIKPKSP